MSATGRLAEFVEADKPFEIREVEVPDPEPGAAVIRVTTANICGSDLHAWHGKFATTGLGGKMPTVLGHEMLGIIEKLGEGVTHDGNGAKLAVGDKVVYTYFTFCGRCRNCLRGKRVACQNLTMAMLGSSREWPYFVGGFADYYYVRPGATLFKLPEGVSEELAAGANCALSQVIFGFHQVNLTFGESVLIQGAGGLGIYAAAIAKARGADQVIVIDGVQSRLEMARRFGADETINLEEMPDPKERAKTIRKLTGGYGSDVVVELVGRPDVIPEGLRMLGQTGRYLEIGNISIGETVAIDPSRLVMANKSIVGVSLYEPWALGEALKFLHRERDRLPFSELLATRFPLEEINTAFQRADRREVLRASIAP